MSKFKIIMKAWGSGLSEEIVFKCEVNDEEFR